MAVDPARAKSLFLAASELADPAERAAYLSRECGEDAELRARVEALLRANDAGPTPEPDSEVFVATLAPEEPPVPLTADFAGKDEGVGTVLAGKYKLVEEIGEGGMGAVFMAQQTEPVRRAVAVKVIKAGMDSKAVLARFEAERQALALMDHPNIARVLDAGTTEYGRPFFVMELVKGIPITQFCDERKLTPRQRLELFVPVCQAIQHAHQKGIIHRDIKPSNVLVGLYDDRAVPKVIDFGVAKAAGQVLTDKTLMTGFGVIVGTPEYMSPEQASLNNLDVDTRSDVYSLGVMLYELLTGTTPVDRKSLGKAAVLEVLRIVREVEPPKPSYKLSTSDALPSIAAKRGTEPAKLSKLMKGELDWVVLKALEKDRARRYATANALARDIQRYLDDEIVEARPPTTGYRIRKFVRRHKGQVSAACFVLLALLAGIAGTSWGLYRAEQRREEAETARSNEAMQREKAQQSEAAAQAATATSQDVLKFFENHVFAAARPEGREGGLDRNATLRQAIDAAEPAIAKAFADRPLVELEIRAVLANTYFALSEWQKAAEQWKKWLAVCDRKLDRNHPDYHDALNGLVETELEGRAELPRLIEEAYNHFNKVAGPEDPNRLHIQWLYARGLESVPGRAAEAHQLKIQALAGLSQGLPADHPYRLQLERLSAFTMLNAGRSAEAVALMESNLRRTREKFPPRSVAVIDALHNTGNLYLRVERYADAVVLLEEGLRQLVARFGPNHHNVDNWLRLLAEALRGEGRHADIAKLLEEYLVVFRKRLGPEHHDMAALVINLTDAYLNLKRYDEIPPLIHEVLNDKVRKTDLIAFAGLKGNLGLAYFFLNRSEAITQFVEIVEAFWQAGRRRDNPLYATLREGCEELEKAGRDAERVKLLEAILRRVRELGTKTSSADTAAAMAHWEHQLAEAYFDVGKIDKALALYEESFKRQKLHVGADDPVTLACMIELATACYRARQFDRSIPLFEEALRRTEAILGREHAVTLYTMVWLGKNYKDAGRLAEAIKLSEEACRVSRKRSPMSLWGVPELLDAYWTAGKATEAVQLIDELLADARQQMPKDSPQLAGALAAIGRMLLEIKRFAEAELLLRECLAIREKTQPDAWNTFNTRSMLGGALLGQKKYAEAEPLLVKGYEGMKEREKTIPPQSSDRIPKALDSLVELYTATNKSKEADNWRAERAKYPQAKKAKAPPK
jgi:serine/threonine protein kinase